MKIVDKYAYELDRDALRERIKKVRSDMGLSQTKMAEKMNISLKTYTEFENMRDIPQRKHIHKFIQVTNVDKDWLLYGTQEYKNLKEAENTIKIREVEKDYLSQDDDFKTIHTILEEHKPLKKLIVKLLQYIQTIHEIEKE